MRSCAGRRNHLLAGLQAPGPLRRPVAKDRTPSDRGERDGAKRTGVRAGLRGIAAELRVSGARSGETLGPGDANPHEGLEHFGLDTADMDADIARLEKMGAVKMEGPIQMPNGGRIAFIKAPDNVRLELIQAAK